MKSKRAEQVLDVASFTDEFDYRYVHFENAREAVELAEQDAEEEVNHYRKELEESKRREELACKVIDDQRKEIEEVKARAVEACCFACTQSGAGCDHRLRTDDYYLCDILNNFIQKLNEQ